MKTKLPTQDTKKIRAYVKNFLETWEKSLFLGNKLWVYFPEFLISSAGKSKSRSLFLSELKRQAKVLLAEAWQDGFSGMFCVDPTLKTIELLRPKFQKKDGNGDYRNPEHGTVVNRLKSTPSLQIASRQSLKEKEIQETRAKLNNPPEITRGEIEAAERRNARAASKRLGEWNFWRFACR